MDNATEEISEAELLQMAIADRLVDLHVAMPAHVDAYDVATQTVTCTPQLNRALPNGAGSYVGEALPQLTDVPVKFPRCGQFALTFPLVAGDYVLLVFCERSLAAWRALGTQGDPGDIGTHTLDGAVAIPGLYPDAKPAATADATNMVIGSETDGNSRIELKPTGGVNLGAGATKGVARVGDPAKIDSPGALATWMGLVETFVNGIAPGTITVLSSSFAASPGIEIKTGSANVKAVD